MAPYRLESESETALNRAAEEAVQFVIKNWLDATHAGKGGIFRAFVFDAKPNADYRDLHWIASTWAGGNANIDKRHLYQMCVMEKPIRLANNVMHGHVSSFQSRTKDKTYAGAILFRAVVPEFGTEPVWIVFSFSGLPEMADEAVVVRAAYNMRQHGWQVDVNDLWQVIGASNNPIFKMDMAA